VTFVTQIGGYNSSVVQPALLAAVNSVAPPLYCNQSGPYHWDFGPGLVWQQPQCVAYFNAEEFSSVSDTGFQVHTNFVHESYQRNCVNTGCTTSAAQMCTYTTTLLDPPNLNAVPPGGVTFLNFPTNCSEQVFSYANAYIYGVDNVTISVTPYYTTSWGAFGLFDSIQFYDAGGATMGPLFLFTGGTATLKLSDLFTMAGISLDGQNVLTSGLGLSNATTGGTNTNSQTKWPPYRLTGTALRMKFTVANFKTTSPVNFNVTAAASVVPVNEPGYFVTGRTDLNYMGSTMGQGEYAYDLYWTERRWQSVRVVVGVEGTLGHIDVFTAITAIFHAFVASLIAVTLTDCAGQVLSAEFAAEKFEDNGTREAVNLLLEKEADHGVPFNLSDLRLRQANGELSEECYEAAIFRLEKEIDELRDGGQKVRKAAAIMAEELNMAQLLDESGPPPAAVYKLQDASNGDEILLFPGDNVLGRGIGAIKTATVSRKQLCVTIDPDSMRAFVRSMRADKSPSVPAIKRTASGQKTWRALSQKGQSLALGDTLCLQIKPGAPGQEPGAIHEYVMVTIEAPPLVKELGFFDKLKMQIGMPL
jgi:hypothetical protein